MLVYSVRPHEPDHELHVHFAIGRGIARLMGTSFGGLYDASADYPGRLYLIPTDTIIGLDHAHDIGIKSEADLFGGVAPHAFVPTKAITHPLIQPDACAPTGWSHDFSQRVADSVLTGLTAFTLDDARRGGQHLLKAGAIRIKPVLATAGRGQVVITNTTELHAVLDEQETDRLSECGLVLEEHLDNVDTYSVGQVRVAGMIASYVGTQRLTPDNHGELVYGGSDLTVVRGDFDALLRYDLGDEFRLAIFKARVYDQAASECFPGLLASRRNYDIARGVNSSGRMRVGVLEQSWRTGGASSAEIAALEVFRQEPATTAVRASTLEIFGESVDPPTGAIEIFRGVDKDIGPLCKYVTVTPYDD